ncbi:MAG: hypothetical protein QXY90_04680 [Candidatus Anstonellales archaeon]
MKERHALYKLCGLAVTGATVAALALWPQDQSCDNGWKWWREVGKQGGNFFPSTQRVFERGVLEIIKDPQALFGLRLDWPKGRQLGKKDLRQGNITTCYQQGLGTAVVHRDGRMWYVPGEVRTLRILDGALVAGYRAERSNTPAQEDKCQENEYKVIIFRDKDVVILRSMVSAYAVKSVTKDYVIYNVSTEDTHEQWILYNDGTEEVLNRIHWKSW